MHNVDLELAINEKMLDRVVGLRIKMDVLKAEKIVLETQMKSNLPLRMPRRKKSANNVMLSANCKRSNVPPHMPRSKKRGNSVIVVKRQR